MWGAHTNTHPVQAGGAPSESGASAQQKEDGVIATPAKGTRVHKMVRTVSNCQQLSEIFSICQQTLTG